MILKVVCGRSGGTLKAGVRNARQGENGVKIGSGLCHESDPKTHGKTGGKTGGVEGSDLKKSSGSLNFLVPVQIFTDARMCVPY